MDPHPNLSPPKAPPPPPGSRHTVRIEDIAFGGEGVARVQDFVLFVPFVIPGETVEVEVIETRKTFGRARPVRVVEASPERVSPQCRYFGECGGCQYQHIDYAAQLRLKQKQVADLLQRIGGFDPDRVAPVVPCPQPYGYRNRIMVRTGWNKPRQALDVGFMRHASRWVVDVEECRIAEPALNQELTRVRAHPPSRGGLKVVLRIPPEDWEVPRDSFFQNNFFLLSGLVTVVAERIEAAGVKHLVDAYCGVGFFGISLAARVESFAGIELDARAIQAARRNAARHGAANGEFLEGDVPELLPGLLARLDPSATAVLLDPPRKGCSPDTVRLLRELRPTRVLYVSCHPATLARDLKALGDGGTFRLERVIPLDMFPQTQHVECVAELSVASAT